MSEKTLIILKPGCLQRGIAGEIISRIEKKGFLISAMKMVHLSSELAEKHYIEHKEKPFFGELVTHITSSPVVLIVVSGDDAIRRIRAMAGPTKPEDAQPGTIRGDYAIHICRNIIHTSDSPKNATREITNFFAEHEIIEYSRSMDNWI